MSEMPIRTIPYKVTVGGISPQKQRAGRQGDHNATVATFEFAPELISTGFWYRFEFVSEQGAYDTVPPVQLSADQTTLPIKIVNGWTQTAGYHTLRLVISDADGAVAYTGDCLIYIDAVDTGTTNTPDVIETGLTALILDVEAARDAAQAVADTVGTLVGEATAARDGAVTAEDGAEQAFSDMLAMMGSDIATLTGGKLTPSQIPAIAVTDTFVVDSEAAMLALIAQTGDVCIRTDESKTYILQGSYASVLANWQRLQSPTNYADESGHAATADEATNANTINNKRIVGMTQAQYDSAVIDADTFYFVAG